LLPYVVFEGDFLRWFVKCVRSGNDAPAKRFVEATEPLMTTAVKPPADDRVWNLAGVCFVEGLVMQGDDDVVEPASKATNSAWPIGPKPLLTITTVPGLPSACLAKRDPTWRGR
jgi:hypothetical protein